MRYHIIPISWRRLKSLTKVSICEEVKIMNTRTTTQKVIKNIYSEKKSLKFKHYIIKCLLSTKESSTGELEEHEMFKEKGKWLT